MVPFSVSGAAHIRMAANRDRSTLLSGGGRSRHPQALRGLRLGAQTTCLPVDRTPWRAAQAGLRLESSDQAVGRAQEDRKRATDTGGGRVDRSWSERHEIPLTEDAAVVIDELTVDHEKILVADVLMGQ